MRSACFYGVDAAPPEAGAGCCAGVEAGGCPQPASRLHANAATSTNANLFFIVFLRSLLCFTGQSPCRSPFFGRSFRYTHRAMMASCDASARESWPTLRPSYITTTLSHMPKSSGISLLIIKMDLPCATSSPIRR